MSTTPIHICTKESFHRVFNDYYKPLLLFAKSFLQSVDESKDLVQEVFVALWNSQPTFNSEGQLRSYLYTSVKNKCLNDIKHQNIKRKHAEETQHTLSSHKDWEVWENKTAKAEALHTAISMLSERRKAVVVHSMKGMANEEIASQMNISINTVKVLKAQAYKEIRALLSTNNNKE